MWKTLSHAKRMCDSDDSVPQHADSLHLELDDVAALQPATVSMLEDAARADGARAEHVARAQLRVPRGMGDNRLPAVVHVRQVSAGPFLAVHARDHHAARPGELVRCDDDRAEARREVL